MTGVSAKTVGGIVATLGVGATTVLTAAPAGANHIPMKPAYNLCAWDGNEQRHEYSVSAEGRVVTISLNHGKGCLGGQISGWSGDQVWLDRQTHPPAWDPQIGQNSVAWGTSGRKTSSWLIQPGELWRACGMWDSTVICTNWYK